MDVSAVAERRHGRAPAGDHGGRTGGLRCHRSACHPPPPAATGVVRDLRVSGRGWWSRPNVVRRSVERDLDGAQRRLVAASEELSTARDVFATEPDRADTVLESTVGELQAAATQLRDVSHGIYPAELSRDGLDAAPRGLASRSPHALTVRTRDVGRRPADVEAAVYFCCAEAVQTAVDHSGRGSGDRARRRRRPPGVDGHDQRRRRQVPPRRGGRWARCHQHGRPHRRRRWQPDDRHLAGHRHHDPGVRPIGPRGGDRVLRHDAVQAPWHSARKSSTAATRRCVPSAAPSPSLEKIELMCFSTARSPT